MSRRIQIVIQSLAWLLIASLVTCGWAQSVGAQASAKSAIEVEFGLGNYWKLGQLCPVRIQLSPALRQQATSLEIHTLDGDGVELVYQRTIDTKSIAADDQLWVPIRIGRQFAPLSVHVLAADELLYEQSFEAEQAGKSLSSSQPMIVAIGASMGVEALSRSSADGETSTFSTVLLDETAEVPHSWSDYSSCDLVVLACSDTKLLQGLQASQWTALDTWIRRGGACILSVGGQAEELSDIEQLNALLPGTIEGTGRIQNPGPLESLVATEVPLNGFPCSVLEPSRGKVDLTMSDSLSRSVPWWITYSHGHGTVRFVASDLGDQAFQNWPDRKRLWTRLIAPYLDRSLTEINDEAQVGESSYLGYSDLVGQLRATLDLFPDVRVISFGQVAAMLIGVLLLIGPMDYFLSVKWLKRPDFSWYFAATVLAAVSVALTWFIGSIRPGEVHINTAQIIDVDAANGAVNGRLWSHVYSGSARQLDMEIQTQDASTPIRIDWQGLPGRGLGGLLSQLNTDRGMPSYEIRLQPNGSTQIAGVGIPAAGTKCLAADWVGTTNLTAASTLTEIPGVDQLEGELANPLSVDLLDPVLYYHNWVYSLNSRIPAGQSTTISFDTIPKDMARRLNGRQTVDSKDTTTKWEPADRNSIDRLLELMMFYKSASGQTYTSLTHRFQPQIDQSNLLQTDRAILVGRVEKPWANMAVTISDASGSGDALEAKQDVDRVWCRIAVPVKQNVKK